MMVKKALIFLLIIFFSSNNLSYALPSQVNSKICSATTKVCVSNITNKLTTKDNALLEACKSCCTTPQLLSVNGCANRCQKSCEKAYKKATSGKKS